MIAALLSLALTPAFAADAAKTAYGAPVTLKTATPLAEALARPEDFVVLL